MAMVNDTIVNAKNFSDRLFNEVILWSNDFARDLGVTYGELWAGITIFVVFMIVFYNVMLLLSWYCPKLKKTIKYTLLDDTRTYCPISLVYLSNDGCCCKS